ncbi:MAG: LamG domain-containing protein, partial [Patescibacteria group bacterium]|nr:LamG domain-containing protein [Patescibacteria group bacterium]
YYYTYSTGTSSAYELTSYFESDKYQSYASTDGGVDPTTYEVGTNLTLTPFLHGLVGYWPLNEGSGTTAYDKSGWGNEGTLSGATDLPTWTTSGCLTSSPCLSFDGTDDYVKEALINYSGGSLSTAQGTALAWVYPTSDSNSYIIDSTSSSNEFDLIWYPNAGYNGFAAHFGPWGSTWASSPSVDSLNSWYLIAGTADGTNTRLYVNGKVISAVAEGSVASVAGWYTGSDILGTAFFPGKISAILVYNHALTAAEIADIYSVGNP